MSEHHPDMDLIMALAGGELAPEEAARIESQLDPEARAELATQRAALAGLEELRRPDMTTDESLRLRAAVREALHLERDRPYETVSRPGRRHWLARGLPALAAAASLVAVIAIAVNLADRPLDEQEAFEAAATMAPATTVAAATTAAAARDEAPTTAAMLEENVVAAEEAMAEEEVAEEAADMVADVEAATAEAEAAMAREAPAEAPTTTAATTPPVEVTDTTEALSAEDDLAADLGFTFSTDRPDDALRFTDMVIAERGDAAFPLTELEDRATAQGLICWAHVTDAADPGDEVSYMGYGLIDGQEGEVYRVAPVRADSQEAADEADPVILLFGYPDCRPIDFRGG